MLSGYWLLCDLDGTLISTPHKAQGGYLPLTMSPCFHPLQRWLLNGGNLCVVTTADTRTVDQIFLPLRSCLAQTAHNRDSPSTTRGGAADAQAQPQPPVLTGPVLSSSLLLSMYTGAALFYCTANEIRSVPAYTTGRHRATKEATALCMREGVPLPVERVRDMAAVVEEQRRRKEEKAPEPRPPSSFFERSVKASCVRGTCMDRQSSTKLRMDIKLIYTRMLRDILLGEPKVVSALQRLSRRYKNMWKALLVFLDVLHTAAAGTSHSSPPRKDNSDRDKEQHSSGASSSSSISSPPAAAALRTQIEEIARGFSYAASKSDVDQEEEDLRLLYRRGKESAAEVEWKVTYFKNRMGLLSALGILRIEYIDDVISFDNEATHTKAKPTTAAAAAKKSPGMGSTFHSPYGHFSRDEAVLAAQQQKADAAAREEIFIQQHCYHVLTADLTEAAVGLVVPQLVDFVTFMRRLLQSDGKNIANGLGLTMEAYMETAGFKVATGPSAQVSDFFAPPHILNYQRNLKGAPSIQFKDVAQVIVLGIPLALFSRYFKEHVKRFICGGVNAMPQPNSVVFSKIGVSKSTALRYLLGKDIPVPRAGEASAAQAPLFCGAVEPGHALAFGDNPHSTDYELTVFRDIPFLSVEKDSQRSERHARIARRLMAAEERELRGVQPLREADGTPAATFAELTARLQHSGTMMDDRLLSHLVHIGGEEEGSAIFLTHFMNILHVPTYQASLVRQGSSSPFSQAARRGAPAAAAAGAEARKESPVSLAQFKSAFGPAATMSRATVHSGPLSKL